MASEIMTVAGVRKAVSAAIDEDDGRWSLAHSNALLATVRQMAGIAPFSPEDDTITRLCWALCNGVREGAKERADAVLAQWGWDLVDESARQLDGAGQPTNIDTRIYGRAAGAAGETR